MEAKTAQSRRPLENAQLGSDQAAQIADHLATEGRALDFEDVLDAGLARGKHAVEFSTTERRALG